MPQRAHKLLQQAGITIGGPHAYDPQVHDARVYRDTFFLGSLGLGDAYVKGWWDCASLDVFFYKTLRSGLEHSIGSVGDALYSGRDALINLQSVRRALQVAEMHYDLGNDLYTRMLGESMAYSSAYFADGEVDLTRAQFKKFDVICKKLGLKPGMRVLEIGCGWGTFASYAAKTYGVEMVGVTVSKEQLAYAQTVCAGLPVLFYFGDYRTLPPEYAGTFDRVVSIEMIEAVGTKNLRAYMSTAARMLKENGQFLIQAIVGSGSADVWISTRIFPNGVLPSLEGIAHAARRLFTLTHLESFGLDYDKTLMAWDERFRNAWHEIEQLADDAGNKRYDIRFYRMWRYYLMVCAGAFRSRKIDVCHLVLLKNSAY